MEILLLQPEQITREVLNILLQLADTKGISVNAAREIVSYQQSCNHITYVGYEQQKPIAIGSVVITDRLIHNGGHIAFIEDVAVLKRYQGKGYGRQLVKHLTDHAQRAGAYKVILSCSEENEEFYEKCGFHYSQLTMRQDLSNANV